MIKKIFVAVAVFSFLAGCSKNPSCDYNECSIKAPDTEIQAVQGYLSSKGITNAVQHCSGLYYVVDNIGTGKHPNACSTVNVDDVGTLTNGNVFDQNTGYSFSLSEVIPGWRNGIPQVRAGGEVHLYVPPTLGYGSQPYGPIPANSILVFDVKLNAVQ